MKKLLLSLAICFASVALQAQSDKYSSTMAANIAAMDTSFKDPSNLIRLSNTFERIGMAEKTQWLPYYYAALTQVNYGFVSTDKSKTDIVADKAEALISKADSLSPNNSEISTLKSMIASCRLMVDPMSRYMEYGPVSAKEIENAIAQDPTNPRPYYLRGQGLKYTPEQFGGGCKTAKVQLETAIAKYATFKPQSPLSPNWGKQRAQMLLDDCNK